VDNITFGSNNSACCSQLRPYIDEVDENPRIRAPDDRPVLGNHASHGVRSSGRDNDSRGTGVLPPHGGAVRKLHDAGQSFLLQDSGTNEHCSPPGAGCRAGSSPYDCCDTAGRLVRRVAGGDSRFPSYISSCPTSRTVSRL